MNIATAVLVVAVLVVVYLLVSGEEEEKAAQETEDERPVVQQLDSSEIAEIRLRGGEQTLTLRRYDDAWLPDYPYDVPFDNRAIERVVEAASELEASRIISEDPSNVESYGLSEPTRRIEVELSSGETRTLLLGSDSPSGAGSYLQREGEDTVYLIASRHARAFRSTIGDIRDKSLPSITRKEMQRLTLVTPEQTIELVPVEEDDEIISSFARLKLVQPYMRERSVSTQGLQDFVKGIPRLRVSRFIEDRPDDLSAYGLGNPRVELSMSDKQNTVHLLFGSDAEDGGVYAKEAGEPGVFTVDTSLEFADVDPFTLVDKFVVIVNIKNTSSFRIEGPENTYTGRIEREEVDGDGGESGSGDASSSDGSGDAEVETTYYFEGKEMKEDPFKDIYQKAIGLTVDSDRPDPVRGQAPEDETVVSIEFEVFDLPVDTVSADIAEHGENFHAVYRDGVSEFLISKLQVRRFLETLAERAAEHTGSGNES
jgi:hypothetical protein